MIVVHCLREIRKICIDIPEMTVYPGAEFLITGRYIDTRERLAIRERFIMNTLTPQRLRQQQKYPAAEFPGELSHVAIAAAICRDCAAAA